MESMFPKAMNISALFQGKKIFINFKIIYKINYKCITCHGALTGLVMIIMTIMINPYLKNIIVIVASLHN